MTTIIRLNDGSGKRFVLEKAKKFIAEPYWNGKNHVCGATRKEGETEELYLTARGMWVLHYCVYDNEVLPDTWTEITNNEALEWIKKHARRYIPIALSKTIKVKNSGITKKYSFKTAIQYNSDYYFDKDRSKFISKATKVKYEHETLYKSVNNKWFIHWTSDVYGVDDTWREISEEEAIDWLRRNAPNYLQKE